MKLKFLTLFILLFLGACTHSIHLAHVGGFDPYMPMQKGQYIEARSEQKVIMGLVFDTEYVNEAYDQLKQQCSDGSIQGTTTQFSTSHGFFSWTNKILLKAYCFR